MVFEEEAEVVKSGDSEYRNVKYCKGCGKEWDMGKTECCNGVEFFGDEFNSAMKKYVELFKSGDLGNYYVKALGKKGEGRISMNKKRMAFYLLKFKDKLECVDEKDIWKIFSHI